MSRRLTEEELQQVEALLDQIAQLPHGKVVARLCRVMRLLLAEVRIWRKRQRELEEQTTGFHERYGTWPRTLRVFTLTAEDAES